MSYQLASTTWDNEEIDSAIEVIKSKNTTMGVHVSEFEKEFAQKFGSRFAVMSNSGSSANLLAIAAMIESGMFESEDKTVIVPAVSWSTTYFPFHQYGFKLRFADIDLKTLNYDLSHLEKITREEKIDAICAVNLLGNTNDFNSLKKIAGNIPIFEDNCESMGANFDGKQAGTHGLLGSFSTFFSHHMCTMEGGVTVTDDEKLYQFMLAIRAHGWTRNLPDQNFVTGVKSQDKFEESFKFVVPGYNLRPLEVEAAIGKIQLRKLNKFVLERRKNAEYFKRIIAEKYNDRIIFQEEIGESSWFGFSMIFENPELRKKMITEFESDKIDCRPIVAGNFCRQPVIKKMNCKFDKLENADIVHDRGLFVGNHHFDLEHEIQRLDATLERALS
jgi:CDP-6-deoxy-D-xylo-4-hexulose-3-dehydrase